MAGSGTADADSLDEGNDVAIGDHGQIILQAATTLTDGQNFLSSLVTRVMSTDAGNGFGGSDHIEGNLGNDILIGGDAGDTLYGETPVTALLSQTDTDGDDVILGDNGLLRFDVLISEMMPGAGDDNNITLDLVLSTDAEHGGNDTILGGDGNDLMIGGVGVDTIIGDNGIGSSGDDNSNADGNDVAIGDHGRITLREAASDQVDGQNFRSSLVSQVESLLGVIVDDDITTDELGDADYIEGNIGRDVLIGGDASDTIYGAGPVVAFLSQTDGDDVILGDHGLVRFDVLSGDGEAGAGDNDDRTLDLVLSQDTTVGAADTIFGSDGNDLMIGGVGGDLIIGDNSEVTPYSGIGDLDTVDEGNDVAIGDHGRIALMAAGSQILGQSFRASLVTRAESRDAGVSGGVDHIEGNLGRDILIGGDAGDTLYGETSVTSLLLQTDLDGDDVILGDNGQVRFDVLISETMAGAGDDSDITLDLVLSTDTVHGGDDTILGGDGNDLMIGGVGADTIIGDNGIGSSGDDNTNGDGNDVAIGDHGRITLRAPADDQADGQNFRSSLVSQVESIDAGITGGIDHIEGNSGRDILIGGDAGDTLHGETPVIGFMSQVDDDDVILGDHGLVRFDVLSGDGEAGAGDEDDRTLDLVVSQDTTVGGDDNLFGGDGNDLMIGGVGADTIIGDNLETFAGGPADQDSNGDGNDVAIGDHGRVTLNAFVINQDDGQNFRSSLVSRIESTDAGVSGGIDHIEGNYGRDILIGGGAGDILHGETPVIALMVQIDDDDVILGDHGLVRFDVLSGDGEAGAGDEDDRTLDLVVSQNPTIGGDDNIFGGDGNDLMIGGVGADTIIGDNLETFAGGPADQDSNGDGNDVAIGDHGRITLNAFVINQDDGQNFRSSLVSRVESIDAGISGGIDHIEGNLGRDILIGGDAGDTLHGETPVIALLGQTDDDDVIIGDNGLVRFDVIPGDGETGAGDIDDRTLDLVVSQDTTIGGVDAIFGGDGNDLLIGGVDGDTIIGDNGEGLTSGRFDQTSNASGQDVILGDNGRIVLWSNATNNTGTVGRDGTPFRSSLLARIETTDDVINALGGADLIEGNDYADIIIGGLDADTIYGESQFELDVSNEEAPVFGGGGETLNHGDVIIGDQGLVRYDVGITGGGDGSDDTNWGDDLTTFTVSGVDSLILADMIGDDSRDTLDLVITGQDLNEGTGDTIYGNNDRDIIFGGLGDDVIHGDVYADPDGVDHSSDYGEDMLVGDGGVLTLRDGMFTLLATIDTDDGGSDMIAGNEGSDVIIGGMAGDYLYGEADPLLYGLSHMQADKSGDDVILGDNGRIDWVLRQDEIENRPDVRYHLSGNDGTLESILVELDDSVGLADYGTLDRIMTTNSTHGGDDVIFGNGNTHLQGVEDNTDQGSDAGDIIFGGTGADFIVGDSDAANNNNVNPDSGNDPDGADLIFGDHGKIYPHLPAIDASVDFFDNNNFFSIDITAADMAVANHAEDVVFGNGGDDIIIGGQDDDVLFGGADDDDIIGGFNVVGGDDELDGLAAADRLAFDPLVLFGDLADALALLNPADYVGYNDVIDGGGDDDVIAGDNASIIRQGSTLANSYTLSNGQSPRYRMADGEAYRLIIDTIGDPGGAIAEVQVGFEANLDSDLASEQLHLDMDLVRRVTLFDHTDEIAMAAASDAGSLLPQPFGNDVIAGGFNDDEIFGQLGDDIIQGDGTISINSVAAHLLFDPSQGASPNFDIRDADAARTANDPSAQTLRFEVAGHANDGDDYIEGNGGNDRIYGGLGQDDIIGGSSGLFGLAPARISLTDHGGPGVVAAETLRLDLSVNPGIFQFQFNGLISSDVDVLSQTLLTDLQNALDQVLGVGTTAATVAAIGGDSRAFTITFDTAGRDMMPLRIHDGFRPDGADMIHGGAGDMVDRNNGMDANNGYVQTGLGDSHGRDADVILGDNGEIYRLVDALGDYETFAYANATLENGYDEAIIPRSVNLLDYQYEYILVGGDARDSLQHFAIGAGDLIYGEAGDDIIHGMTGDDVIFGNDGDDDLYGEVGNDWISGGVGRDGILGDDGLILTSRNVEAGNQNQNGDINEALYGINVIDAGDGNLIISTPGNIQQATINILDALQKDVELISFRTDDLDGIAGLFGEELRYNDIIFGGLGGGSFTASADTINQDGLGGDFIHSGDGDDAVSGAEALPAYYSGDGYGFDQLNAFLQDMQNATSEVAPDLADNPFWFAIAPYNPGEVLRFEGNGKPHEFALYDEFNPRRRILFEYDNWTSGDPGSVEVLEMLAGATTPLDFILNFDASEGPIDTRFSDYDDQDPTTHKASDGDDRIFGDLGNDWLVGGTGRDHMFGGRGDDMLNMDDDHESGPGGSKPNQPPGDDIDNTQSDEYQAYADIAYGGAGRDVMLLNTGADRAIDWVGEYNSFIVPFSPFGAFHISRALAPQIPEFLQALSESDGADIGNATTLTGAGASIGAVPDAQLYVDHKLADVRTDDPDPARNFEPFGELGMVRQSDFDWQDQTGAPSDPQPGNLQGQREIMRRELFTSDGPGGTGGGGGGGGGNGNGNGNGNGGGNNAPDEGDTEAAAGDQPETAFAGDTGTWSVSGGSYNVLPADGSVETFSVYHVNETIPVYVEILVTAWSDSAKKGFKSNAFIIFDYYSDTEFKFAGVDLKRNKLLIGHRTDDIAAYLATLPNKYPYMEYAEAGWVIDSSSNLQLDQSGQYDLTLTLHGAIATLYVNQSDNSNFVFGGPLNDGYMGLGSLGAKAHFDDFQIQKLPPTITLTEVDDFASDSGEYAAASGSWNVGGGEFTGDGSSETALALRDLPVEPFSRIWLESTFATDNIGGLVFDYYTASDFKFVALDVTNDKILVGHYGKNGMVIDSELVIEDGLSAGVDYQLSLVLQGAGVTIALDDVDVFAYAFNSILNDGQLGMLSEGDATAFDEVTLQTDDAAYAQPDALSVAIPNNQRSAQVNTISEEDLAAIAAEAIERLKNTLGLDQATVNYLMAMDISISDLPGQLLGLSENDAIVMDVDGAGHGWFVDQTPGDDAEFTQPHPGGASALPGSDAYGEIDLLTALMHEFGHRLGYDHMGALHPQLPFMADMIQPSERLGLVQDGDGSAAASEPAQLNSRVFVESLDAFLDREELSLLKSLNNAQADGGVSAAGPTGNAATGTLFDAPTNRQESNDLPPGWTVKTKAVESGLGSLLGGLQNLSDAAD